MAYKNRHEELKAQGLILVGNETFPVSDSGKFVLQVKQRAGYEMPTDATPGTQAEAEADQAAWLEAYPDAETRIVEIN